MDLTSIDALEAALGHELESGDEGQAQYYITLVSRYIEAYTRVKFEETTTTIHTKSDYYGVVELPGGPVVSVDEVLYFHGSEPPGWQWDGDDMIYGLEPKIAVDVTYTYGYDSIPEEIAAIATEGAKRLMLSPDGQEAGPLLRYKVGDVEEMYKPPFKIGIGGGLFNDLETMILDEYRVTATTWRIGFTQPTIPQIPESESALFE